MLQVSLKGPVALVLETYSFSKATPEATFCVPAEFAEELASLTFAQPGSEQVLQAAPAPAVGAEHGAACYKAFLNNPCAAGSVSEQMKCELVLCERISSLHEPLRHALFRALVCFQTRSRSSLFLIKSLRCKKPSSTTRALPGCTPARSPRHVRSCAVYV